jgi:exoribonuclease-2
MAPTQIEVDSGIHRTLGVDAYVQASSPIRRYGDLIAQRQLTALIEGRALAYQRDDILAIKNDLERCEKQARRAEGDRDLYLICRWLERRKDEVFEGVVSRPPEHGRGLVWLPFMALELPLSDPPEGTPGPRDGERVRVKVKRAQPRKRAAWFEVVPQPPAT